MNENIQSPHIYSMEQGKHMVGFIWDTNVNTMELPGEIVKPKVIRLGRKKFNRMHRRQFALQTHWSKYTSQAFTEASNELRFKSHYYLCFKKSQIPS